MLSAAKHLCPSRQTLPLRCAQGFGSLRGGMTSEGSSTRHQKRRMTLADEDEILRFAQDDTFE